MSLLLFRVGLILGNKKYVAIFLCFIQWTLEMYLSPKLLLVLSLTCFSHRPCSDLTPQQLDGSKNNLLPAWWGVVS